MNKFIKAGGVALLLIVGVIAFLFVLWFAGAAACPTCGGPFK